MKTMSFSADVLANIKTSDESDNELEEEFLDAFPEVTSVETAQPPLDAFEEEDSHCEEDPLEENVEVSINTGSFVPEFNDEDVGCCSSDEDSSKAGRGAKKARLTELKGRNGYQWSAVRGEISTDAVLLLPSGKGPARMVSNVLEAWMLLIDERMMTQIVRHTNEEIRSRKGKSAGQRLTDATEMQAWLGLNYLCGIFRNSAYNGPLDELWTLELGNAVFRAAMSFKRFEFLADCIRFHEFKRGKQPPLEPVQDIWERFTINCRSYYAPSSHCAIDEHIFSSSDEKCPLQYTLPSNPLESGLRMVTMCDTKTLYMYNGFVAGDATPTDMEVLHLICDIKGTGRTLTLSQRYTTIPLAQKLQQYKVHLVGALPESARELPTDLLLTKTPRKLYAPNNICLTAGVGTAIISSGFLLTAGLPSTISGRKLYGLTSQSCQRCQQLCSAYSAHFATPPPYYRWPLHFFHNMLNYAAYNSWVLLRLSDKGDASITQRDCLRQLGLYLTQQQLKRRLLSGDKVHMMQRLQIAEILGESTDKLLSTAAVKATNAVSSGTVDISNSKIPEGVTLLPKLIEKRARCRKCKGANCRKTKTRCQQCLRPLCPKHLITRCDDCTGVVIPSAEPVKEGT